MKKYEPHRWIWRPVFEDEPPKDPPPKDPLKDDEPQFSQKDVNRMLAEDKRKHQDQTKKALDELEALKTKATLTVKQRDELEQRMDELRSKSMTQEEILKRNADKAAQEAQDQIQQITGDRDAWQGRYTTSRIVTAITNSAVENKAFVPEQLVAILQPMTQLVEETDEEDEPTGVFSPKVRFPDTDKAGKPITLELSVPEAVKRMLEIEKYQNLFEVEGVGGIGNRNKGSKPNSPTDIAQLAKDPEAYRKARKDGKLQL